MIAHSSENTGMSLTNETEEIGDMTAEKCGVKAESTVESGMGQKRRIKETLEPGIEATVTQNNDAHSREPGEPEPQEETNNSSGSENTAKGRSQI